MKSLLIFAVVLLCAEALGRFLIDDWLFPPVFEARAGLPAFALRARYELRAGGKIVTTDGAGHRTVPGASTRRGAREVHLIGDSQVFGWGLSDGQTIAARLQALLGDRYRVVNDGVPGYGPYAYADELARVPPRDVAVVFITENNDLWDMYSPRALAGEHCGYLIVYGSPLAKAPCAVLHSGLVRIFTRLRARLQRDTLLLPLNREPSARFAAHVLDARMLRAVRPAEIRLGRNIVFTYVPWDGELDPAAARRYVPRLDSPARSSVTFRDDAGVLAALRAAGGDRFQPDGHLTAGGAAIAARAVADTIRKRVSP